MPYDDARFNVHHMLGPIFASFASGLLLTAANKTTTTVNVTDRIQFFRNIKLTGAKAITKMCDIVGVKPTSHHSPKVIVTEGTRVCATASLGTAAGVNTAGGISSTYSTITTGETLQIKLKMTQDGTAATTDQIVAEVYLEYQEVM